MYIPYFLKYFVTYKYFKYFKNFVNKSLNTTRKYNFIQKMEFITHNLTSFPKNHKFGKTIQDCNANFGLKTDYFLWHFKFKIKINVVILVVFYKKYHVFCGLFCFNTGFVLFFLFYIFNKKHINFFFNKTLKCDKKRRRRKKCVKKVA